MNFIQKFYYKVKYKQGAMISGFVAHDIRLEIVVVDNSTIEDGLLTVRKRFIDCFSLAKNKTYKMPEFSEPEKVKIAELWKWNVKIIRSLCNVFLTPQT